MKTSNVTPVSTLVPQNMEALGVGEISEAVESGEENFTISLFESAKDNVPLEGTFTWHAFADGFRQPEVRGTLGLDEYLAADRHIRATQKDGFAWSPVTFNAGSTRSSVNVQAIHAFVGDIDDGEMSAGDIAAALKESGCLVHSSYSSSPSNRKYRVVVRYARPVSAEEHPRLWQHFDRLLEGHLDQAAKDPSRLYYYSACPPGAESDYEFYLHGEALCDPDVILKRLDADKGTTKAVLQNLYPVPDFSPGNLSLVDTENCVHRAAPASEGEGSEERLRRVLSNIPADQYDEWIHVGMALKNELGDEGLALYHEWSGRSDKYDPDEVDRKWQSFSDEGAIATGTVFHIAKRYSATGASETRVPMPECDNSAIAPVDRHEFEEMTDLGIKIEHDAQGWPKYPVDALGDILSPAALKINETVQAPLPMCGQSLLSAVSLVVQAHANVKTPDGREMPTSLFALTVGESGERKSHVDRCALKPVRNREFELQREAQKKRLLSGHEKKIYEKKRDAILDEKLSVDEVDKRLDALGVPPDQPRGHQILVNESTFEGLFKLFLHGQPSMGMFSDEGGRMVGGNGMSKDNALKMAAGLSSLWDASPLSKTTSGEGSSTLRNRRLSMHLMMQPGVAQQLLGNPIFRDQGLLARCLICHPESTIGYRRYKPVDPCNSREVIRYHNRLQTILVLPHKTIDGDAGYLEFRHITMSKDANEVFVAFTNWVETQLAPGARYRSVRGFGAKAAEQATRIAGVLSLFNDIKTDTVEREQMAAGASLALYALEEALRHCGDAAPTKFLSPMERDVSALNDVIGKRAMDNFTTGDLARFSPPRLRRNEQLMPVLTYMCRLGLLERLEPEEGVASNRGVTWRLLPPAEAA